MKKNWIAVSFALAVAAAVAGVSPRAQAADGNAKSWKAAHPRRAQVNHRLKRQNRQVNKALTNKKLTYQQGSKIKSEDRSIRHQERQMARANGGHITPQEQKTLNQEENKVHREIKRDETANAQ